MLVLEKETEKFNNPPTTRSPVRDRAGALASHAENACECPHRHENLGTTSSYLLGLHGLYLLM